jgi:hypothetical protein
MLSHAGAPAAMNAAEDADAAITSLSSSPVKKWMHQFGADAEI